jgi:putative MFS transporter
LAQGLSVLAAAPPLAAAAAAIGGLAVLALGLIAFLGRETRGRDLGDLEDPR